MKSQTIKGSYYWIFTIFQGSRTFKTRSSRRLEARNLKLQKTQSSDRVDSKNVQKLYPTPSELGDRAL